jgi:hypothetical protein
VTEAGSSSEPKADENPPGDRSWKLFGAESGRNPRERGSRKLFGAESGDEPNGAENGRKLFGAASHRNSTVPTAGQQAAAARGTSSEVTATRTALRSGTRAKALRSQASWNPQACQRESLGSRADVETPSASAQKESTLGGASAHSRRKPHREAEGTLASASDPKRPGRQKLEALRSRKRKKPTGQRKLEALRSRKRKEPTGRSKARPSGSAEWNPPGKAKRSLRATRSGTHRAKQSEAFGQRGVEPMAKQSETFGRSRAESKRCRAGTEHHLDWSQQANRRGHGNAAPPRRSCEAMQVSKGRPPRDLFGGPGRGRRNQTGTTLKGSKPKGATGLT